MIKRIFKAVFNAVKRIKDELAWARIRVDFRNGRGYSR
jgi:hypothetical protein